MIEQDTQFNKAVNWTLVFMAAILILHIWGWVAVGFSLSNLLMDLLTLVVLCPMWGYGIAYDAPTKIWSSIIAKVVKRFNHLHL